MPDGVDALAASALDGGSEGAEASFRSLMAADDVLARKYTASTAGSASEIRCDLMAINDSSGLPLRLPQSPSLEVVAPSGCD